MKRVMNHTSKSCLVKAITIEQKFNEMTDTYQNKIKLEKYV